MKTTLLQIRPDLILTLRPLGGDDAPLLLDLFAHMGDESRYTRFHTDVSRLDPATISQEAARMAQMPASGGAGWLLLVEQPPEGPTVVGAVRLLYLEGGPRTRAEISLSIRDDFQGRGIGRAALAFAAEQARLAGIRFLEGDVLPTHTAVFRLIERLPYPVRYERAMGETRFVLDLTREKAAA